MQKDGEVVQKWYKNEPSVQAQQQKHRAPTTQGAQRPADRRGLRRSVQPLRRARPADLARQVA